MSDFHLTVMGDRFFNGTMPALVRQLSRLNDNLEHLATLLAKEGEPAAAEGAPATSPLASPPGEAHR